MFRSAALEGRVIRNRVESERSKLTSAKAVVKPSDIENTKNYRGRHLLTVTSTLDCIAWGIKTTWRLDVHLSSMHQEVGSFRLNTGKNHNKFEDNVFALIWPAHVGRRNIGSRFQQERHHHLERSLLCP